MLGGGVVMKQRSVWGGGWVGGGWVGGGGMAGGTPLDGVHVDSLADGAR